MVYRNVHEDGTIFESDFSFLSPKERDELADRLSLLVLADFFTMFATPELGEPEAETGFEDNRLE